MSEIMIAGHPVQVVRIDELPPLDEPGRHLVLAVMDGTAGGISADVLLALVSRADLANKLYAEDVKLEVDEDGPLNAETVQAAIAEIVATFISIKSQTHSSTEKQQARENIGLAAPASGEMAAGTGTSPRAMSAADVKLAVQALAPSVGVGQTWQNVSASRARNTDYVNNTGRPIQVAITTSGTAGTKSIVVGGVTIHEYTQGERMIFSAMVPHGKTYRFNSTTFFHAWSELR